MFFSDRVFFLGGGGGGGGLDFFRLKVRNYYVWGLVFLCLGVSFLTFGV